MPRKETVQDVRGREKMHTDVRTFIDSNILLYAIDRRDRVRRQKARSIIKELIKSGLGVVSTQVAQEFYVIATKKLGVDPLAAKRVVEMLHQLDLISINIELILGAIDCSILSKISFWDALIVVSARSSGCKVLLSEDLADSQIINGVRVRNPFLER
jgi:predicted nucleic acid-binding protein